MISAYLSFSPFMSHNQSVDFAAFQAVLRKSRNVVAVAGAGLSAASGLSSPFHTIHTRSHSIKASLPSVARVECGESTTP